MIKRDETGIICQHDPNVSEYMDGGDSASRTGIMALCGSEQDKELLPNFLIGSNLLGEVKRKLVRHPNQKNWNISELTSRDQLVCYAAGCFNNKPQCAQSLLESYNWFINKDILMPDVRNHLKLCAGKSGSWLGYLWLNISILCAAYIKPDVELNQLICMCLVAGPKYMKRLVKYHPNIIGNINKYWCGYPFRDQNEIYQYLFIRIMNSIK